MKGLTARQKEVLDYISVFTEEQGFPPTVREVSRHFGISLKAIQDHITALQKKGFLAQLQKRARSLSVSSEFRKNSSFVVSVPVLGSIVDADNFLSKKNVVNSITISEPFVHTGHSYFAFKVVGASLSGAGILDGDIAICEPVQTASDGQIVIAVVDSAVMLRRFRKEDDRVLLLSENPDYKPLSLQNVDIKGVLVSVLRGY
jgi:repressor LexA